MDNNQFPARWSYYWNWNLGFICNLYSDIWYFCSK